MYLRDTQAMLMNDQQKLLLDIPINAFCIVFGVAEKLKLFKGRWAWKVTHDCWMVLQERIQRCSASLLRAND